MGNNDGKNNFLSQFEGSSYQNNKNKPESSEAPKPAASPSRTMEIKGDAKPSASKPTASPRQNNSKIKAPDHLIVEDKGFHKRKMVKLGIIGISAIAVMVVIFFIFRMFNSVEVKDFTNTTFQSAESWGLQNRVTVQRRDAYNLEYEENHIFGQNIEYGTTVQRGAVIILDVSKGADMNEVIDLPDFEEMTTGEINTWRTQMRTHQAVQIRQESHETIEAGQFIALEHAPAVDLNNFTRNDRLTVVMSEGPRLLTMPNFVGRNKADVEEWAEENDLSVQFEQRPEADAEPGSVLQQNIEPRDRFSIQDEIIITISAGQAIIVPNFANLSQEDALEVEGLQITRRDRFSTSVPFGRLIEQSVSAGTELIGEDLSVTLVYSLGRPFMENLVGMQENIIPAHIFDEFISRGANITYVIRYVDSYEPKGQIVAMSRYSQWIGLNDNITFDVSRGNLTRPEPEVPDFPSNDGDDPDY